MTSTHKIIPSLEESYIIGFESEVEMCIPASRNSHPFMKITASSRKRSSRLTPMESNIRKMDATIPIIAS